MLYKLKYPIHMIRLYKMLEEAIGLTLVLR
jgi:hypothetical protein